jgi:hypothetical protein
VSCGHQFCEKCDSLLIHLLHRQGFESASGLGQIIWRDMPRTFACGDVDLYLHVRALNLVRFIEHKQPAQKVGDAQKRFLILLASLIEHCREQFKLHEKSGVFVIRGALEAGRKRIGFSGPQTIYQVRNSNCEKITCCDDVDALYRWMICR